jgi:3',5'-cyclic-AMP phosphodiesterase
MLRIGFISDLHIGPSEYHNGVRRKLTEHAEAYLNEFVEYVSRRGYVAFGVQLGDLIQDSNLETDHNNYCKGIKILSQASVPIHHLIGNHDEKNLSLEELRNILGLKSLYYSFDEGAYHFVFLFPYVPLPDTPGGIIPDDQLAWLEKDLARTNNPTFVFAHQSFADQDLTGNPWFDGLPGDCLVENRVEVRKIFSASGKVAAVVNGHLHWNHVDWHDGIPYITVQSATENVDNKELPSHAWGVMEINGSSFSLVQYGNDSFEHHNDFKVLTGR